jgi:hypothetical protein
MTKYFVTFCFCCIVYSIFSRDLELIKSQIDDSKDIYENSIENYKSSEMWRIWAFPIGDAFSSSELKSNGQIDFSIKNISDLDLNTAWIEGKSNEGIDEQFGFTFNFSKDSEYGGAYEFFGIVNLFNGYCKSIETWQQYSRVKRLKVFYNKIPLCIIELADTWHLQYFDIGKFFKYKRDKKYMNAPYEIKRGDKLTFEIIEVYYGSKYKNVALSEFIALGAGN